MRSFDDAGLHPAMRKNVELAGYEVPTPIQAYCIPAILKGHDVVACAQTGLSHSNVELKRVQLTDTPYRLWQDCRLSHSHSFKVDGKG